MFWRRDYHYCWLGWCKSCTVIIKRLCCYCSCFLDASVREVDVYMSSNPGTYNFIILGWSNTQLTNASPMYNLCLSFLQRYFKIPKRRFVVVFSSLKRSQLLPSELLRLLCGRTGCALGDIQRATCSEMSSQERVTLNNSVSSQITFASRAATSSVYFPGDEYLHVPCAPTIDEITVAGRSNPWLQVYLHIFRLPNYNRTQRQLA